MNGSVVDFTNALKNLSKNSFSETIYNSTISANYNYNDINFVPNNKTYTINGETMKKKDISDSKKPDFFTKLQLQYNTIQYQ